MNKRMILPAMVALGFASIVTSNPAKAQTAKDLVGTWQQIANVNIATDGKRTETFGSNPKGMAMFSADGHFMIINGRNDLPKFAANSRVRGTADENAAIVHGSIALFGTYSVADKVINLRIDQSTYPNWNDTESKRNILTYTGDELKWSLAASIGGQSQSEVTWKRMSAAEAQQKSVDVGKTEYVRSCAVCHGTDGKGNGPLVVWLKKPAADLTKIQKNNMGVFPFDKTYWVIDGREAVEAHGTRDMPVWGDRYSSEVLESLREFGTSKDVESFVRGRIIALTGYVYSLQEK